jgi:uncharacterized protein (TIGR00369 family)
VTETTTRTVEFAADPAIAATAARGMAGIEYLSAVTRGELAAPPIFALMNMSFESVEHGRVTLGIDPDYSLYNAIGAVHGGAICTILDSATGCATHSTLEAGLGYTSVEIKVNYLRATTADSGHLTATGTVRRVGRRIGFAEAELVDAQGRLVATASSTLLIFEVSA